MYSGADANLSKQAPHEFNRDAGTQRQAQAWRNK